MPLCPVECLPPWPWIYFWLGNYIGIPSMASWCNIWCPSTRLCNIQSAHVDVVIKRHLRYIGQLQLNQCVCVCMLIYWDWRLITGCVHTCAHLSACIYCVHTACARLWLTVLSCTCNLRVCMYIWVIYVCVRVCGVFSHGVSESKAIHCKPPHSGFSHVTGHTAVVLHPAPVRQHLLLSAYTVTVGFSMHRTHRF